MCGKVIARIKGFKTRYIPSEDVKIILTKYEHGGGNALLIEADEGFGESIATASVNLPNCGLLENEVLIKDYSENEGMLYALIDAGVIKETGSWRYSGFVKLPVCTVCADLLNHEPVVQGDL